MSVLISAGIVLFLPVLFPQLDSWRGIWSPYPHGWWIFVAFVFSASLMTCKIIKSLPSLISFVIDFKNSGGKTKSINDPLTQKLPLRFTAYYNDNREELIELHLAWEAMFLLFADASKENGEENKLFAKLNALCAKYARDTLSERLKYVGGAFNLRTESLDQETIEVIRDFFRETGLFSLSGALTERDQGKIYWTLTEEGIRQERKIKYRTE
jgi:hypothetical protein